MAVVPASVVTVTSTVPVPAGAVAVMVKLDVTTTPVASTPPNLTAWLMFLAVYRLVPVIFTTVPRVCGPLPGLTPVTVATA